MSRWMLGERLPLHVAIDLVDAGHHPAAAPDGRSAGPGLCIDVTETACPVDPATIERVQTMDLLATKRRTARKKECAEQDGLDPADAVVLVDLEVMIASNVRDAHRAMDRLDELVDTPPRPKSLRYIGTPTGLAGLISDIYAAKIADGVVLLPLINSDVLGYIASGTLPCLESSGVRLSQARIAMLHELASRSSADPHVLMSEQV